MAEVGWKGEGPESGFVVVKGKNMERWHSLGVEMEGEHMRTLGFRAHLIMGLWCHWLRAKGKTRRGLKKVDNELGLKYGKLEITDRKTLVSKIQLIVKTTQEHVNTERWLEDRKTGTPNAMWWETKGEKNREKEHDKLCTGHRKSLSYQVIF